MGSKFHSFDKSPLGVFIKSPLGVRGGVSTLVFIGQIPRIVADDIQDVGFFNELLNILDSIGENEGFDGTGGDFTGIREYKKKLYMCGVFFANTPATQSFNGIAVYDNDDGKWKPVKGTDLKDNVVPGIGDMTIHKKQLIVSGTFTDANGVADTFFIAAWDGEDYISLGSTGSLDVLDTQVLRTASFDGDLYASGDFVQGMNPVPPNFRQIKRYDGVTWEELVAGTEDPFTTPPTMLEPSMGLLFIGGNNFLYSWDGFAYTAISTDITISGADAEVLGATTFKGNLVICGEFDEINGVAFGGVAGWDGVNFFPFGSGLIASGSRPVRDVHVDKGVLYASGRFVQNGEVDFVVGIATWNPTDEIWVDTGNRDDVTFTTLNVYNMTSFKGKLDFVPEP